MTELEDTSPEATIGGRIQLARSPWSRTELAEKISCGYQTLRRYEEGERDPPASALLKVCKLRRINIQWLMEGVGPMREGAYDAPSPRLGGVEDGQAGYGRPAPIGRDPDGEPTWLDRGLMGAIVVFVEEVLEQHGRQLDVPEKAALYPDIYNAIMYQRGKGAPGQAHDDRADLESLLPLIRRAFGTEAQR